MSPLEYVVVRNELGKDAKSSVIMSEFVGGSRLLSGAYRFNPYNIREMVNCLEHAIYNCTPEDRLKKFRSMLEYVNNHPIEKWVLKFLKDIRFINHKRKKILGNEGKQLINNRINMEKKHKFVNSKEFISTYKSAESRLILILLEHCEELFIDKNQENVMFDESEDISDSDITEVTYGLIKRLSKEPNTKIFLVCSDEKQRVHDMFSQIDNLGLAAEDGYFYRWTSQGSKTAQDWSKISKDNDLSWIELARSIMKTFTDSTEGSYIEEKESIIAWSYTSCIQHQYHRLADFNVKSEKKDKRPTDNLIFRTKKSKVAPDYGEGQMKELYSLLKDVFCNFDVNILPRKGCLEVKTKIDSQSLIQKIMEKLSYIKPIDFIFTIGNEERYRDVFNYLDNKRNYSKYLAPKCTSVHLSQIKNQQFVQGILMKFLEEV